MTYRMHEQMRFGKVTLKVSNLQRSLDFYQDVIGLRILKETASTATLTADGKNALVELLEVPGAVITPPRSVSGLYHYAILVPTRKDLSLVLRRLAEKGIRLGQSDHLVSEALYIDDPDNNGIEIYRDRPRSEWKYDYDRQVIMGSEAIDLHDLLREAEGMEWSGLPAGTTIGHVHFHVGNLQRAKQFYCDLLGFDVMSDMKGFRAVFISAGGYHHHIGLNTWAGEGAPAAPVNGTGIAYYEIVLPQEELERLASHLEHHGTPLEKEDEAIWVTDPFGIRAKLVTSS